jgi:hypothetical protein
LQLGLKELVLFDYGVVVLLAGGDLGFESFAILFLAFPEGLLSRDLMLAIGDRKVE